MVQIIRHGIGKEDHTYVSVKGLPERMPDLTCQTKFGFDTIEHLHKYQKLPVEQKEKLLNEALNEINTYFLTTNKDYNIESKGNFITIIFSLIQKPERKDFAEIVFEIIKEIKNRILKFSFDKSYFSTGIMKLTFFIRNSGFILNPKNVITNYDNLSTQPKEAKKEMSSQNKKESKNVITNQDETQENVITKSKEEEKKEENVITNKKKCDHIHLRISTEKKTKIQENATKAGYKSVSKYIIETMTDQKNVITNEENVITNEENVITSNMNHRRLHDKLDALEKDRKLLLKLINIFTREGTNTEDDDLTEEDIELIKKHSKEDLKNA